MSKMPHIIPLRDIGLATLVNKHLGNLDFAVVHSSDLYDK